MADLDSIKKLREETDAGITDCKEALEKHKGDFEKAKKHLKKKGAAKAAKRADRETSEGVVSVYLHPTTDKLVAVVEIKSETDFVARNEKFRDFADKAALQVAGMSPRYISKEDVPKEQIKKWKEEIKENSDKPSKQEIEGRIEAKYKEVCLLEQPFIKDREKTIGEMLTQLIGVIGENMKISRFARLEMGKPITVAESKDKK